MLGITMPERLRWIAGALAGSVIALLLVAPPPAPAAERDAAAEVIVRFAPGVSVDEGSALIEAQGGDVVRRLDIINGVGARVDGAELAALRGDPRVVTVTPNAPIQTRARKSTTSKTASTTTSTTSTSTIDWSFVRSAFNQSIKATDAWIARRGYLTGAGVGVAVVDTGIAGGLPDFQLSPSDPRSRVVASAVVNPGATTASDSLGHGTHVAGLIAGNG
ncbi:MAG TPA: S8 family serine peptidase, partial [Solirubrobacteraceae bacterium]